MKTLLNDDLLERSAVVANCRMNRERNLAGSNGYAKELGFNPLDLLRARAAQGLRSRWLDLCCGSGTALIEAAESIHHEEAAANVEILGVDLVGMFSSFDSELKSLRLVTASVNQWCPHQQFDVITCVHGLHYIGDKLGLIERAVSWLTEQGRFAANLDLSNVKFQDDRLASRVVAKELQNHRLSYDSRKKLIVCDGQRTIILPFRYLGADDQAGPNYTGQSAVNSFYS